MTVEDDDDVVIVLVQIRLPTEVENLRNEDDAIAIGVTRKVSEYHRIKIFYDGNLGVVFRVF